MRWLSGLGYSLLGSAWTDEGAVKNPVFASRTIREIAHVHGMSVESVEGEGSFKIYPFAFVPLTIPEGLANKWEKVKLLKIKGPILNRPVLIHMSVARFAGVCMVCPTLKNPRLDTVSKSHLRIVDLFSD